MPPHVPWPSYQSGAKTKDSTKTFNVTKEST